MWRFNIGAGSEETDQEIIKDRFRRAESFKSGKDEAYDWNKQAGQQWFLQAAKDRGVEEFIAFVNSPPVWMTKNGHGQPDPSIDGTNLKEEHFDDFAIFLADVLEHFEQEQDRKSTRLNSSHVKISYAVFCLKKKIKQTN